MTPEMKLIKECSNLAVMATALSCPGDFSVISMIHTGCSIIIFFIKIFDS